MNRETLKTVAFVLFCIAVTYAAHLVAEWGWPETPGL